MIRPNGNLWKAARCVDGLLYWRTLQLRPPLVICTALLWLAPLPGTVVMAQLVQVGPGYVKAPFVRVYSYADGSSYVRAPFVSVHSPPRYFVTPGYVHRGPAHAHVVTQQSPSTALDVRSEFSDLDRDQLRQLARESLERLVGNLSESWREYLSIDLLQQLIDDDIRESSGKRQELLREILANFDATLNSTNVRHVTEAAGFRELYGALVELSVTPQQRKVGQLVAASQQLKRDLTRINAPGNWLTYLHLPVASLSHESSDIPEPPVTTDESVAGLEATLRRYDQTAEDPQYRVIAGLAGFQSTRLRLREYLDSLRGPSTPTSPDTFEQLPVPEPDGQPDPVTE